MTCNTIPWMMAGGTDEETREDRRMREHLTALREVAAMHEGRNGRTSWRELVARLQGRTVPASPLALDCCAA